MKRISIIIICNILSLSLSAHTKELASLSAQLESHAETFHGSRMYAAESFTYSLMNFAHHIKIYGEYDARTLNQFAKITEVDYSRMTSSVRYYSLTDNFGLTVGKNEVREIIILFRIFLEKLEDIYGQEYLVKLEESRKVSLKETMMAMEQWESYDSTLADSYGTHIYTLIEDTYFDELASYLLNNEVNEFLEFYDSILKSDISEESKAQIAQDCFHILVNYQNFNLAINILDNWRRYESNKDSSIHLRNYLEHSHTELARLAFRNNNYYLAYIYTGWVDSAIELNDINSFFNDINEFMRQLEIRALVELEIQTDPDLSQKKVIRYFEYADSLITNDFCLKNGVKTTPGICSLIYTQLADLYMSVEDYESAEAAILKAENKIKGCFNLNISRAKANLLAARQEYDSAIEVLNSCLEYISTDKYNTRARLSIYESILSFAINNNDKNAIYEYGEQYLKLSKEHYYKEISMQPYFQRKSYWENETSLQYMSSLAGYLVCLNERCAPIGYDAALFQKGLLLRFDKDEEAKVMNSGDNSLIDAYQQMKYLQEINASDSLLYDIAERYTYLYSTHPELSSDIVMTSWKDIVNSLQKDEVAIEFIETHDNSDMVYGAYVLTKDFDSPIYMTLCKTSQIESLLIKQKHGGYYPLYDSPAGQGQLYDLIWSKLTPYFKTNSRIYFSPCGLLSKLNIEILAGGESADPLNERFDIMRVSSTALLSQDDKTESLETATLIGAIDYNAALIASDCSSIYSSNEDMSSLTRGVSLEWSSLENTKMEIEEIDRWLNKTNITTNVYMEENASEDTFKSLSQNSTSIIHIATHGFYFTADDAKYWEYFTNSSSEVGIQYISPLKRSGLVMAGGNHSWLGETIPEGAEDGILSSMEIANLDLSNTDLVVLSACQTGLGDINTEGVSGIQQAFKLAGVNTLVMSLWEVSDKATSIMMTNLYKNLSKGKNKREAFNAAVQAVKKWDNDPYYWAAFIMLD